MDPYLLLFDNIEKYVSLADKEKELLRDFYKPAFYKKKQYLLKEGEVSKVLNFVTKGCLRSYYRDENGFAHVLLFAVENWWINDLGSYVHQKPADLFIDALEDTEVLQMNIADEAEMYRKIPKMERFFRILTQNALAALQQRIIANLSKPAQERYLSFRKQYGFLESRLPQHQIASYLGVTPEFLSMIRKKLSKKAVGQR